MKDSMPSKVNEKLQLKYSEKEISLPKKSFPNKQDDLTTSEVFAEKKRLHVLKL